MINGTGKSDFILWTASVDYTDILASTNRQSDAILNQLTGNHVTSRPSVAILNQLTGNHVTSRLAAQEQMALKLSVEAQGAHARLRHASRQSQ